MLSQNHCPDIRRIQTITEWQNRLNFIEPLSRYQKDLDKQTYQLRLIQHRTTVQILEGFRQINSLLAEEERIEPLSRYQKDLDPITTIRYKKHILIEPLSRYQKDLDLSLYKPPIQLQHRTTVQILEGFRLPHPLYELMADHRTTVQILEGFRLLK